MPDLYWFDWTDRLVAWLLTYGLHSTILLAAAWLAAPKLPLAARETLWKSAVVGGLFTASLQMFVGAAPVLQGTNLANTSITGPSSAAVFTAVGLAGPQTTPISSLGSEGPSTALAAEPSAPEESAMPPAAAQGWTRGLAGAWTLFAAGALLLLGLSYRRLRRRLADRSPLNQGPIYRILESLRQRSGLPRAPLLSRSEALSIPIARGVLRPEICLPERVFDLAEDRQESLLAHELAHVLRRDPAWLLANRLLESVFFFQPLNLIARRQLQEIAEFRCDDLAARWTGRPTSLAHCLTEVAGWSLERRRAPAAALVPSLAQKKRGLRKRITRLLHPTYGADGGSRSRWLQPALGVGLLVFALAAPGIVPASGEQHSPPNAQAFELPEPVPTPQEAPRAASSPGIATTHQGSPAPAAPETPATPMTAAGSEARPVPMPRVAPRPRPVAVAQAAPIPREAPVPPAVPVPPTEPMKIPRQLIQVPEVRVPEVSVPPVRVPEIRIPEIHVAPISIPEMNIEIPEIHIPEMVIPEMEMPEIQIPEIHIPAFEIEIPEIEIPEIDLDALHEATQMQIEASLAQIEALEFELEAFSQGVSEELEQSLQESLEPALERIQEHLNRDIEPHLESLEHEIEDARREGDEARQEALETVREELRKNLQSQRAEQRRHQEGYQEATAVYRDQLARQLEAEGREHAGVAREELARARDALRHELHRHRQAAARQTRDRELATRAYRAELRTAVEARQRTAQRQERAAAVQRRSSEQREVQAAALARQQEALEHQRQKLNRAHREHRALREREATVRGEEIRAREEQRQAERKALQARLQEREERAREEREQARSKAQEEWRRARGDESPAQEEPPNDPPSPQH